MTERKMRERKMIKSVKSVPGTDFTVAVAPEGRVPRVDGKRRGGSGE
jgi:hypothetical protein